MAKKEKKISITEFERVVKETCTELISCSWNGLEVKIKPTLSLDEVMAFVDEVADMSFAEDGTYVPEVSDFAFRSAVLTYYANFTLPDNLDKRCWLVYGSDAADFVIERVNELQFRKMTAAIERKIEHMRESQINFIRKGVQELCDRFEEMSNQFSTAFGGVKTEDVQKIAEALASGDMTEEKIVKAYLDRLQAQDSKND